MTVSQTNQVHASDLAWSQFGVVVTLIQSDPQRQLRTLGFNIVEFGATLLTFIWS